MSCLYVVRLFVLFETETVVRQRDGIEQGSEHGSEHDSERWPGVERVPCTHELRERGSAVSAVAIQMSAYNNKFIILKLHSGSGIVKGILVLSLWHTLAHIAHIAVYIHRRL